jgi:hypothetical protein
MDTPRHYTMLIGGDWVDSGDQFEIRSPATEDLVATVAKGGREHALDEYTEEQFIHLDLSGRLDRRAYPLLLSTPPA